MAKLTNDSWIAGKVLAGADARRVAGGLLEPLGNGVLEAVLEGEEEGEVGEVGKEGMLELRL